MITKIKKINNIAVFTGFIWDTFVVDKDNRAVSLKDINILYGRNYSGKTTLSRIIRSFETKELPNTFINPEFECELSNGNIISEKDVGTANINARVFNEDFINDNLSFITNPDKDITAFAILGEENKKLEAEIDELRKDIGNKDNTGLTLQLSTQQTVTKRAKETAENNSKELSKELETKATDQEVGIKYNFNRFGDQNYNITKLKAEIKQVLSQTYTCPTKDKVEEYEQSIEEVELEDLPPLQKPNNYAFEELSNKSKPLVEKELVKIEKIKELLQDATLNNWAKEGYNLHKGLHSNCTFCGNHIESDRWSKLDKHFNEESRNLENEIESLIVEIDTEIDKVTNLKLPDKTKFYKKFQKSYKELSEKYTTNADKYIKSLQNIRDQLTYKKEHLFKDLNYKKPENCVSSIETFWTDVTSLVNETNNYTSELAIKRQTAKDNLRIYEVYQFVKTIDYTTKDKEVTESEKLAREEQEKLENIEIQIRDKENLIKEKQVLMKDEGNGAKKVNQYLNHSFGHPSLSLVPVDNEEEKKTVFEVRRGKEKAFNLSDGEKSLLAFCYFVAKLDDINTRDTKPIIWIDDPISSLDSNHIFFLYSLLSSEIVIKNNYEQLFIATHNLNFLKFLKRLPCKFTGSDGVDYEKHKAYFVVERLDKNASILLMPQYLKNNVTEFNYLFKQIYVCSQVPTITDENYEIFYNFGNNARKFLELYLSYKYPDGSKHNEMKDERMQKFFGSNEIESILTSRLNNEYSHLVSVFERGDSPVDEPEMKKVAKLIVDTIKEKDPEQYEALVSSVTNN